MPGDRENAVRVFLSRILCSFMDCVTVMLREYRIRFPDRRQPDPGVFTRTYRHLAERGNVPSLHAQHEEVRPDRIEDLRPAVIDIINETPRISTRRIAARLGVSNSTVWHILRDIMIILCRT